MITIFILILAGITLTIYGSAIIAKTFAFLLSLIIFLFSMALMLITFAFILIMYLTLLMGFMLSSLFRFLIF